MGSASISLVDYGVDWLTTTGKTKNSQLKLQSLGNSIIRSEQKAGNDLRPWGFAGYQGFKCGGVQLGTREESTCLRLSGGTAFDYWQRAYHAGENFSRVDVQATFRLDTDPQKAISAAYRKALKWSNKRKSGPRVTLLKSNNGTATLYLGQRQSMRYGRCYDKGRESKLDFYHNCVRVEEEIKGRLCLPTLRAMSQAKRPIHWAAREALRFSADRGVPWSILDEPDSAISAPRKRSDAQRKLVWLETQVRPSILMLLNQVPLARIQDALGLSVQAGSNRTKLKLKKIS